MIKEFELEILDNFNDNNLVEIKIEDIIKEFRVTHMFKVSKIINRWDYTCYGEKNEEIVGYVTPRSKGLAHLKLNKRKVLVKHEIKIGEGITLSLDMP